MKKIKSILIQEFFPIYLLENCNINNTSKHIIAYRKSIELKELLLEPIENWSIVFSLSLIFIHYINLIYIFEEKDIYYIIPTIFFAMLFVFSFICMIIYSYSYLYLSLNKI